jgi:trigger factor
VIGLNKGDEIEKQHEAPADFSDSRLAGKTVTYKVKVGEIKEERLADEDDAFAQQVGEGFDTVKALRERVQDDLRKSAEEAALREYESLAVDALVEQASIDFPVVMVDHEIEHILEDEANLDPRDPRSQELYLARLGKSEEEVKDSVRPDAEKRMRRSLVLSKFAEVENIAVEDSDVDAEIESIASSAGDQADLIRQYLGSAESRESIKRSLLTRKTLARLVELTSGEKAAEPAVAVADEETAAASEEAPAPAAEETAPEEKPARRRRSGPRAVE